MLVLIWEVVYKLGVGIFGIWKVTAFPSPFMVIEKLYALIADNTLGFAILASIKRIVIGYLLSSIIGIVLGLVIVRFKYLQENLSALILGLQTLPSICWIPFAILWFELSETAIIFVITIGSTFAITMAIEAGIKNVNPLFIKAAETMGASGFKTYWYVIIPASLPNIISGLKQGWSFAWRGLIAGEMLSATRGLGQVLMTGRNEEDISQVIAVLVVIIILGLVVDYYVFGRVEKNIRMKWGVHRN